MKITDNIHSIFVDQWDWEKVIRREDRNLRTFKRYRTSRFTKYCAKQKNICLFSMIISKRSFRKIFSLSQHSELEEMFPDHTPKEREYYIAKTKGAVCIMQIGDKLKSGEPHDGRAPDYDDWALNADIVVYYPVLDIALELSSMGIRVDEKALNSPA